MWEYVSTLLAAPPLVTLDDDFLYLFLQLGVAGTFLVTAVRAWRVSPARFRELFSAVIFGLLLEEGDILLFGTYSYNAHWFRIGEVPLAIALTWAMIIASAMNFSDALGLPSVDSLPRSHGLRGMVAWIARGSIAPTADAVWAIMLDLSLDAVAIRLKLWTWTIPHNAGWFGVPWGNFYSWLFVAAMFSLFTRLVRRRAAERGAAQGWWQLAVPLFAYVGLLASIVPHIILQYLFFASDKERAWPIFAVTFAIFLAITFYGLSRARARAREFPDRWLLFTRVVIHLYFIAAIFGLGLVTQLPVLLWVAVAMLAVEFILGWLLNRASISNRRVRRQMPSPLESHAE